MPIVNILSVVLLTTQVLEFIASNCRTLRWLAIVDGPTAQLMEYLGSHRLLAIANGLTSQLIEVQSSKTANEREYTHILTQSTAFSEL
jgi:hypothetical protein